MPVPILTTKLYAPPTRPEFVPRPRLIERLNEGLYRKLTLISAPAGFGKTTLVNEWVNQTEEEGGEQGEKGDTQPSAFSPHPFRVAWLSLDENDNDAIRFLSYLVAALQTIAPDIGGGVGHASIATTPAD